VAVLGDRHGSVHEFERLAQVVTAMRGCEPRRERRRKIGEVGGTARMVHRYAADRRSAGSDGCGQVAAVVTALVPGLQREPEVALVHGTIRMTSRAAADSGSTHLDGLIQIVRRGEQVEPRLQCVA
jgi:hypothetical protein